MALNIKTFRINENRFRKAIKSGFYVDEDGILKSRKNTATSAIVFTKIDSGEKNNEWGRLKADLLISDDAAYTIYVFASDFTVFLRQGVETEYDQFIVDEQEPFIKKIQVLELSGAKIFKNHRDILLSDIKGRYLWIGIQVNGSAGCQIKEIKIYNPGDLFLKLFPEIYKTDDDFFKRYLSVFSSIYSDFDVKISQMVDYVDIDKAPVAALPILADWLGIEVEGEFLGEVKMRRLLKNAYYLNRIKGTKEAVTQIAKVILDKEPIIIERSRVGQIPKANRATYDVLYSPNPYSFTVIINQRPDEKLYAQLKFLIDQFKPARSSAKIIFLGDAGNLDTYCYMGVNAKLADYENGRLDQNYAIGQNIMLG